MLSEDALRRLGNLDRDQVEQRIRRIYERWSQSGVAGVFDDLSADVAYPSNGFWTGVAGPLRGRDQVTRHLQKYADVFENIVCVLHEIVIDGDRVVVHRTAVGRRNDTGRRYQCDFIDFIRFRDGLVVEYCAYPDAAWIEADNIS